MVCLSLLRVETTWNNADAIVSNTVVAMSIIVFLIWIFKRTSLRLSSLDSILISWYLYMIGYAYLQTEYPVSIIVLKSTLYLALYLALRVLFSAIRTNGDAIALGIAGLAIVEAVIGINQMINGTSRHYLYPMTGSFFNPNGFATLIGMGMVTTVSLWKKYAIGFEQYIDRISKNDYIQKNKCLRRILKSVRKTHVEYVYYAILMLLMSILMLTWCRAAIIATIVTLLYIYRAELNKYKWIIMLAMVVGSILLYVMKQGSADGRGIIWWVSSHIIAEHPLTGTGIGSFIHQYGEQMVRLTGDMPDGNLQSADVLVYSFNALLHIGVEQGAVGILFAVCTIAIIAWYSHGNNSCYKWNIAVMLITSFFSYTFELLLFQIIMVVVMAHLATEHYPDEEKNGSKRWSIMFWAISLILSLLILPRIKKLVEVNEDYARTVGFMNSYFIKDYYKMLPYMLDNSTFLFNFAKALREEKRYNDSNDMLRRGALVSNDPMYLVMQGNNYKDMDFAEEADNMYNKAFRMMPNRIYPLYKLMLLYKDTRQNTKAREMAERITAFKVKVESPATRDIKNEANKLLHNE